MMAAALEKLSAPVDAVTDEAEVEGAVRAIPDLRGLAGREAVSQLLTAALELHLPAPAGSSTRSLPREARGKGDPHHRGAGQPFASSTR